MSLISFGSSLSSSWKQPSISSVKRLRRTTKLFGWFYSHELITMTSTETIFYNWRKKSNGWKQESSACWPREGLLGCSGVIWFSRVWSISVFNCWTNTVNRQCWQMILRFRWSNCWRRWRRNGFLISFEWVVILPLTLRVSEAVNLVAQIYSRRCHSSSIWSNSRSEGQWSNRQTFHR